jgi:hypothetical protein
MQREVLRMVYILSTPMGCYSYQNKDEHHSNCVPADTTLLYGESQPFMLSSGTRIYNSRGPLLYCKFMGISTPMSALILCSSINQVFQFNQSPLLVPLLWSANFQVLRSCHIVDISGIHSGHFYHFMMTMYPFKHRTILDTIEPNDTL